VPKNLHLTPCWLLYLYRVGQNPDPIPAPWHRGALALTGPTFMQRGTKNGPF